MGTKISWTDSTINPVVGCSKVGEGCRNCYAENMARRLTAMGLEQYQNVVYPGSWSAIQPPITHKHLAGTWNGHTAFVPSELEKPYRWKKPKAIFISSMGDLFHESVPFGWIDRVWQMIFELPRHNFIILTKRPERMKLYIQDERLALPNIAIGVSVEDQATANERIPVLLKTPAAKRFISYEPAIGPVDFSRFMQCDHAACNDYGPGPCDPSPCPSRPIAGIIVGGESGPNARPLHPEWVRLVRDQCAEAGVPFFFKQWGEWAPYDGSTPDICDFAEQTKYRTMEWENDQWNDVGYPLWCDFEDSIDPEQCTGRVGRKAAGNTLDGRTHTDLPWSVKK